jgi:phage-related protein
MNEDKTLLNFALVANGTIEDFESVRSFLKEHTTARLIYQTKGYEKLMIVRGDENE